MLAGNICNQFCSCYSTRPSLHSITIDRYIDHLSSHISKAKVYQICAGRDCQKKHIYELARKSYFAVLDQGDGDLQDFIHTPNFILVDTKKQIRGIYDGTVENEISRLIQDINILVDI